MADTTGTLEKLSGIIAQAVQPLQTQFTRDNVIAYFLQLGALFPDSLPSDPVIGPTLDATAAAAGNVSSALAALSSAQQAGDTLSIIEAGAEILDDFKSLLAAIDAVGNAIGAEPNAWAPLAPSDVQSFTSDFATRVFEDSLLRVLEVSQPELVGFGVLIGLIDRIRLSVAGLDATSGQVEQVEVTQLQLGRLADIVSSPVTYLENLLGWGGDTLDINALLLRLQAFTDLFGDGTTIDTSSGQPVLTSSTITAQSSGPPAPEGVSLTFKVGVPNGFSFSAPLRPGWDVSLTTTGQMPDGITVTVRPPSQLSVASPIAVTFTSALTRKPFGTEVAVVLLGQTGATRLQADSVSLAFGFNLTVDPANTQATGDVFIQFAMQGSKAVLDFSQGDSFISSFAPSTPTEVPFDLSGTWSIDAGLQLKGGGALILSLPINVTLGPIEIPNVYLSIAAQNGAFPFEVSADLNGTLGPIDVTINRIGALANLTFPTSPARGNLGPADLAVGFKFPTGVGITVDAGSVHGGGFISYDPTNSRYVGALQLSVYDIAINAFGLIETKLSTGPGYSFVIVISAQFTPIQLGFGFTLNGVGGMVGINRAIDATALANLVRAGQSEDLLFPQNVVADAPTIVRDLTTVFPATQGHYVFGPLGKLGWGTPTLITGEIGVILEFPGPVVVILGEVKCILPKSDAALVKLNLSVDGELDFPNKTFAMDAALHDSVINGIPVSGQMAMRVAWGDQPNFVFSIGGFHPAYTPPPNFPKLQPLTLDLGNHGPAKISVSGFFAITSNTVQVGGTASLHASGAGLSFDASVSVKALFVFQPFSFEADINASVKVSFHGYGPSVQLSGTLDGPSPWHVSGEVCVSVLWWDACLGFDVTFGGDQQVTQPSIDPWAGADANGSTPAIPGLQEALSDAGNWTGALVPGTVSSVTRAQGTDTLLDPVGGLTVRQKTAPVETANPLTRFGVAKTTAPISFSTVQAKLGTGSDTVTLTPTEAVSDFFAPAQFFDMDDGKKLSSAAFEPYQAGYLFATATGNVHGGTSVTSQPQLQTIVINSDGSDTVVDTPFTPTDNAVSAANTRSAVAKGGLTQAGTRRFINRLFTQPFTEQVPTFVIATSATLVKADQTPDAAVRSATLIALDTYRAQNIDNAAAVEVAASFELPPSG